MPNPYGAPETDVQTVSQKLNDKENFVLVDVREPDELRLASLNFNQVEPLPLSVLAREQLNGLPDSMQDKDAEIVVFCHTGVRSAQVTVWLRNNGWSNVLSMAGGIDAWARQIDNSVGFY